MVTKCKLCSRENSIDILRDTIKPYTSDSAQYQTVVAFDCRGLEPVEFEVRSGSRCGILVRCVDRASSRDCLSLVQTLAKEILLVSIHCSLIQARSGWTVEHRESGATFEDVDLTEKEWADYDERSDEPVGITEIEHQFVKVK